MKIALYCTCGAAMYGAVSPDEKAEKLREMWNQTHSGEGHAPCDARTAARAREREEQELAEMDSEFESEED